MVLVVLTSLVAFAFGSAGFAATTRDQQAVIAKWTGENICALGVERFYGLPEAEIRDMFEQQTGMSYDLIPLNPTETERVRITNQLTGYLSAVCPRQLDLFRNR